MDRIETKTRIIMELKMPLRYGHGVSPLELHRRVVNSEKGTPFGACINELVQRDVILSSYRYYFLNPELGKRDLDYILNL